MITDQLTLILTKLDTIISLLSTKPPRKRSLSSTQTSHIATQVQVIESIIGAPIRKYGPSQMRYCIPPLATDWQLSTETARKRLERLLPHTSLQKASIILELPDRPPSTYLYIAPKGMDLDTITYLAHSQVAPESYPPYPLDENGFPIEEPTT